MEIERRVRATKQALIAALLAPDGIAITGNDFITYINALIQQPLIVLLYEDTGGEIVYRKHFDFEKAQKSRGSLQLRVRRNGNFHSFKPDDDEPSRPTGLFRVFHTNYLLRIFLLNTNGDDQPFYEVQNSDVSSGRHSAPSAVAQEYTKLCIRSFLDFDEQDRRHFGESFIQALNTKLSEILSRHCYIRHDGESSLLPAGLVEEFEKFNAERLRVVLRHHEGLDLIYTRASYGARTLKLLGTQLSPSSEGGNYPNLFFMARTYDRVMPRAREGHTGAAPFSGFAHNVSILAPETQRKDILSYFSRLSDLGQERYRFGLPIKNELYGEAWDFVSAPGYKSLALDLNRLFWRLLGQPRGPETMVNILMTPVGDESTSMVDPIFYYGASIYRMPFRRLGGLERVAGIKKIYADLGSRERESFATRHLRGRDRRSVLLDCLRVVAFFYLTRMLGPPCTNQAGYYTKVHLYPITVAGAIVGTVGRISFQPKVERLDDLPVSDDAWNQEFFYYTKIVSEIRRSIDNQYRAFQISRLVSAAERALIDLIETGMKTGFIARSDIRKFSETMNSESRLIARVCPLPTLKFELSGGPLRVHAKNMNAVMVGPHLTLTFAHEPEWDIFRALVTHGSFFVVQEIYQTLTTSLAHRFSAIRHQIYANLNVARAGLLN